MSIHSRKEIEDKRRQLRSNMTQAEGVLWNYLRRKQLKGRRFRRQHSIGPYIVDFYCHAELLIIEVDGGVHFDSIQMDHDVKRSAYLKANGFNVLRFHNQEVFKNTREVLKSITDSFKTD